MTSEHAEHPQVDSAGCRIRVDTAASGEAPLRLVRTESYDVGSSGRGARYDGWRCAGYRERALFQFLMLTGLGCDEKVKRLGGGADAI